MKHRLAPLLFLVGCASHLADPAEFESTDDCPFDVQADLLVPRCALEGCHRPGDPPAGLEYVTSGLRERLVDVEAQTCLGTNRLDSMSRPNMSHFLTRIGPSPQCGTMTVERMPLAHTPLDDQELACVQMWASRLVAGEER